jgi:hypothetical protein
MAKITKSTKNSNTEVLRAVSSYAERVISLNAIQQALSRLEYHQDIAVTIGEVTFKASKQNVSDFVSAEFKETDAKVIQSLLDVVLPDELEEE